MPTCRFRWEAIPSELTAALAAATERSGPEPADEPYEDAVGDPVEVLRGRYGDRPGEDFVHDLWTTLRDEWLVTEPDSQRRVVAALRAAGLGRQGIDDPVAYLRSVRNATTLRGIVLDEFLRLGGSGTPGESGGPGEGGVVGPVTRDQLGIDLVQDSPQGRQLLGILVELIGQPDIVAIGRIRDTHVFAAYGERNRALVLEEQERPGDAHRWRSRLAFRTAPPDPVDVEIEMLRWDPWLEHAPDDVRNATRAQRRAWDAHRRELAERSDTLTITHRPDTATPPSLTDLSSDEVAACWSLVAEHAPHPPTGGESAEEVGARLLRLLRSTTGNEELAPDDDGDIPIQFGSSMVFVRVFGDPPIVRVFSPVLERVSATGSVAEVVNDLNRNSAFTKWLALDDTIIAVVDLFGSPFDEQHVVDACSVVGNSADRLDEELQAKLGGRTFFGEVKRPDLPRPTGGYL